MLIQELFILSQPLIQFLGTICLIVLTCGSALLAVIWILKKIWKYLVAAGALTVLVVVLELVLEVV